MEKAAYWSKCIYASKVNTKYIVAYKSDKKNKIMAIRCSQKLGIIHYILNQLISIHYYSITSLPPLYVIKFYFWTIIQTIDVRQIY